MDVEPGRQALLRAFRWSSGHADVWRVFADPGALAAVVAGLVAPWRGAGLTHVAGVESRGFLLGGAAAVALDCGFIAIRKSDGLLPGPKVKTVADTDYRGNRHLLRIQSVLGPADRVLLVDDWAERGSQALAAKALIKAGGGAFAGVSLLVDQLDGARREALGRVTSLVRADELGPSDGARG